MRAHSKINGPSSIFLSTENGIGGKINNTSSTQLYIAIMSKNSGLWSQNDYVHFIFDDTNDTTKVDISW